jgi:N-acetylglutamate synthase-like GNAT family acetyltransferase
MPNPICLSSNYRFRPALPPDRHQIRWLLRTSVQPPLLQGHLRGRPFCPFSCFTFCTKVLLGLALTWLVAIGGMELALYVGLGCLAIAMASWLNQWLFEDWQSYWVVECNRRLIACGQLNHFMGYSVLSDVVVTPAKRQQGIGSFLVASIAQIAACAESQPLYLACEPNLARFYQNLGFSVIESRWLMPDLKRELGLDQQSNLLALRWAKRYSPEGSCI